MAAHVLGSAPDGPALGTVTLHRHQMDAVRRLKEIVRAHAGALLADEVGLGKTFVALAVAAEWERVTVVAPASLRSMWAVAGKRAGVRIRFVSMELLGHGGTVPSSDFLIVDEAHHFRNDRTKRYRQLADACARCSVLLLSATPVQNEIGDLRRVLSLVLGRRTRAMSVAELSALIVRRGIAAVERTRLPRVEEPVAIELAHDTDCLEPLCNLPAPLPPSDGGYAHALLTLSLVRQWASSRAALVAALTRRLAMSRAMEDALVSGRHPTRHELALWRFSEGDQQLAFPELTSGDASSPELLNQVRTHADAVRDLMAWLRRQPDIDAERAERVAEIVRRHPGERIVAFSEFAETVTTLYRHLAATHRVALLTHGGGRVAGGAVTRAEILRQFGASSSHADHERIDLLIATDVLSEGVDLQGASVIIHLDLAWNPARLEQRVGRMRRIGAARERVAVYLFSPPAPAERLLQLDRRLRAKLGDAARSVGLTGIILPGVVTSTDSAVGLRERALAEIESWVSPDACVATPVAAVQSTKAGALACVRCGGETSLVSLLDGVVETNPSSERLASIARSGAAPFEASDIERACEQLHQWMSRRSLGMGVSQAISDVARSRRAILERVNGIARRSRRHQRGALASMLTAARSAATITMPAGAEQVLGQIARAPLPDDAWLRAVGEFAAIHGRTVNREPDAILALLLLVP